MVYFAAPGNQFYLRDIMLKFYNGSSETGKQILRLFVLLDEATQVKALEMMRESGGTNE